MRAEPRTEPQAQQVDDDMLLFRALGRLPFDLASSRAVVEQLQQHPARGVLAPEWAAACRRFLAAPTCSQREHYGRLLGELHALTFRLGMGHLCP